MLLRVLSALSCTALLAVSASVPLHAQMGNMQADSGKPLASPAAVANVTLAGQTLTIKYNAPSLRGRALGGPEIVPYNQVWRTGANPATTLITPVALHIGSLLVPAGTYTLYSLPTREKWMLIINQETGQWGTVYHQDRDLGRVELKSSHLPSSQEVMSISFDDIKKDSAELHIRWATTDEHVKISTP